jgi:NTP pyrophosphatase (non-canonical NTP hydrolase)
MDRIDLLGSAVIIRNELDKHFDPATAAYRQVMCTGEEAGEFIKAYRQWAGLARQKGTRKKVEEELADIIITAYVTAVVLGIDLDEAVEDKLQDVLTRGWKEWEDDEAAVG